MENLLANMSVWGVLLVLLTTIRIAFWKSVTEGLNKASFTANLFFQKIHLYIQLAYKPLTITLLSAFVLFVCYKITGDRYVSMWASAVVGGVFSIGISALIKPGVVNFATSTGSFKSKTHKIVHAILDEKHITNRGALFISLISLLLVLTSYQDAFNWNAYAVLSLAASFAFGASGLLLCISTYEFAAIHYPVNDKNNNSRASMSVISGKFLSNDRFDTLYGTLVAAMLLGTTMCDISTFQKIWMPASPVILPLVLAISGVGISSLMATVGKINQWKKDPISYLTEKMISAVLMIIAAYVITQSLLPSFWVCNGIEYTSMQVFYAAQAGIIGGLLTNKVVQGYKAFHLKYFSYLVKKSYETSMLASIFHFLISTLSTILPVLLIVLPILFSYQMVGLYGIVIALISMLANLSTELTISR